MQTDTTSETSNEVYNQCELVYKDLLVDDWVGVGALVLQLGEVFGALIGLAEQLLLLAHLFSSNVRWVLLFASFGSDSHPRLCQAKFAQSLTCVTVLEVGKILGIFVKPGPNLIELISRVISTFGQVLLEFFLGNFNLLEKGFQSIDQVRCKAWNLVLLHENSILFQKAIAGSEGAFVLWFVFVSNIQSRKSVLAVHSDDDLFEVLC